MLSTVKIEMTLRALIEEARALLRRNGGVRSLLGLSSALLNTILKSIVVPLVVIAFISLHQAHAKPFTFNFPARFSLASLVSGAGAGAGAGGAERRAAAGVKPYTGLRVSNETLRMIYWFDQTVAVVELGPEKLLLNCELIEVFDDADGKRLLGQLSRINRPLEITFEQMMKLMQQCQQVEGVERLRVTRAEAQLRALNSTRLASLVEASWRVEARSRYLVALYQVQNGVERAT